MTNPLIKCSIAIILALPAHLTQASTVKPPKGFTCPKGTTFKSVQEEAELIRHFCVTLVNDKEVRTGKYVATDSQQNLLFEGVYANDLLEGQVKNYFPNGKVEWVRNYSSGKREGLATRFAIEGYKSLEIVAKNDLAVSAKEFYPNGKVKGEGNCTEMNQNLLYQGKWTYYYDTGEKQGTVEYLDDRPSIEREKNQLKVALQETSEISPDWHTTSYTVENDSKYLLTYSDISVLFFNKKDEQLGTDNITIANLKPNQKSVFKSSIHHLQPSDIHHWRAVIGNCDANVIPGERFPAAQFYSVVQDTGLFKVENEGPTVFEAAKSKIAGVFSGNLRRKDAIASCEAGVQKSYTYRTCQTLPSSAQEPAKCYCNQFKGAKLNNFCESVVDAVSSQCKSETSEKDHQRCMARRVSDETASQADVIGKKCGTI